MAKLCVNRASCQDVATEVLVDASAHPDGGGNTIDGMAAYLLKKNAIQVVSLQFEELGIGYDPSWTIQKASDTEIRVYVDHGDQYTLFDWLDSGTVPRSAPDLATARSKFGSGKVVKISDYIVALEALDNAIRGVGKGDHPELANLFQLVADPDKIETAYVALFGVKLRPIPFDDRLEDSIHSLGAKALQAVDNPAIDKTRTVFSWTGFNVGDDICKDMKSNMDDDKYHALYDKRIKGWDDSFKFRQQFRGKNSRLPKVIQPRNRISTAQRTGRRQMNDFF